MSMEFRIGQNDSLPKIYATLSAEYDADIPSSEHVIHNEGDTVKLYIQKDTEWVIRDCTIEERIDGGKEVKVSCLLQASDVEVGDKIYNCYFRNETIKLSFPIYGYGKIYVDRKGHSAE